MAMPTNNVRVMVAEASGCWASAVSAVETERPKPSAGHIQPMPMVRPAVAIEAMAMSVMLSMVSPLFDLWLFQVAGAGAGSALTLGLRVAAAM